MSDSINVTPGFVLAGNATFTVSNGSGKHFTYRVRQAHDSGFYFLFILTKPDNTDDDGYTYVGRILPVAHLKCTLKSTRKSKYPMTNSVWRVGAWALRAIWQHAYQGYELPPGMSIKHIGNCGRCGRMLTTPESLDTGLGPECAAQMGIDWTTRPDVRQTTLPIIPTGGPSSRRTKQNPGPNRRKGPRTLHIIDEHTSAHDFTLAVNDLSNFFDPSKHHGDR